MGLDYLSDNLIELRGPVNVATGAAVDDGSAVTAKLYDTALDCRVAEYEAVITEDADAAAAAVFVTDNAPFVAGLILIVELDDGRLWADSVTSITGTTQVDLSNVLPSAASEGNKITITKWGIGATLFSVDNFGGWKDGMNMEITRDDGTLIERIITLVDRDSKLLTLDSSIDVAAAAGKIVKRRLGTISDDLTLASFGTFPASNPVAGDPTWGFRATIPHDHPDFQLGMRVRGEITLIDTVPTPDLNLTRKVVGTLINQ